MQENVANTEATWKEVSRSSFEWSFYVLSIKYVWWTEHCEGAFVHLFRIFISSGSVWFQCSLHACIAWVFVYAPVCMCACVRLIALVTQAVSHSHCSKLWVGEGHCGADRGDGKARGDGGWVGEKETERDDDEKLKAARKWDVGLHSIAIVFTVKKYISPCGLEIPQPLRGESFSFLRSRWQRAFSQRP